MRKKQITGLKAHFIGIGGIGISALARWFLAQGWSVSGSDLTSSHLTGELKKEGVEIKIGHKKSNFPKDASMAIYSNAVTPGSPGYVEFEEAARHGIRPMSYPQTLGCLTEVYQTIAIAGSHGKSTTTSLVGLILKSSPLAPTIVVGTKLKELGGKNFHLGKTRWLVIEADEWRGAFLHYHPDITLITNIDREHLDFYKDLDDLKETFLRLLKRTKPGGSLVLNRDDKNLFSLSSEIKNIAKEHGLKIFWYSLKSKEEVQKVRQHLRLPGVHNLSNALGAYTIAHKVLGLDETKALKAMGQYQGAWRRMEYRGESAIASKKVKIFDDYAHHPSEIKATLQAFREKFPESEIISVFQPHQTKRLKALYKEFLEAFDETDQLILLPTYEVAGRDNKEQVYTSEKLAKDLGRKRKTIFYLAKPKDIRKVIARITTSSTGKKSSVIIMMGAGDVVGYTPLLLA